MLFLAAAETTMDKLKKIPPEFWWKVGTIVLVVAALVIIVRKVSGMNKMVLGAVLFVIFTVVGFNWIYERNEPAFMTPVINKIAPFFPSKGAYNAKQQQGTKP
ncbi:MAG TPA: hypothetical protein PLU52_00135 [Opitutaceae bacterium]|nr:hypothetical protein [Opitutaceae bacterium]HND60546.1 hypothetical protein [Opitutaceae bacterium]